MTSHAGIEAEFDRFAASYDVGLARGLAVSGEPKEYFASERVRWLWRRLDELGSRPHTVLDFGCGTGTAAPFLLSMPGVQQLVGVDTSARALAIARQNCDSSRAHFEFLESPPAAPTPFADLVFCNGVFHHIQKDRRPAALEYVHRALRLGGYFAFWENNPWNPGARMVMSRIPFDRDAIVISPPSARRLVSQAGFRVVRTDWLFIFPRLLQWLRPLEANLASLPLGAQYLVLSQKRLA